jgi:hypothetical protein
MMNLKELKLWNKESHDSLSHKETQERKYESWKKQELKYLLPVEVFRKLQNQHIEG